jgi:hypothetical protein
MISSMQNGSQKGLLLVQNSLAESRYFSAQFGYAPAVS